jgi:serine/threonine-protein kinase RsbT
MALALGFSAADANQVAVTASELGRHLVFQNGGMLTLIAQITGKKGIKIVAQDRGPGIENVEEILAGRCPPPLTLGRGVLEIRQIIDEFELKSVVGSGTMIRVTKWAR